MGSGKDEPPIPPRFVQGTAVRIGAPWLRTRKDVARSRAGIRVVADNGPRADQARPGEDGPKKD